MPHERHFRAAVEDAPRPTVLGIQTHSLLTARLVLISFYMIDTQVHQGAEKVTS